MKQIAHILRKDVEHLWPVCVQVWVLIGLHVFSVTHLLGGAVSIAGGPWGILALFAGLSGLMLPLALAAMAVVAIQQEPLTTSTSFWLTRPYSRVALITEKVLFVSLFGLLPMIIHDVVAVSWFGLTSTAAVPVIVFETLELGAFLAFVASIAVLTSTFARSTAVAFGVLVVSGLLLVLVAQDTTKWGLLSGLPGLFALTAVTAGAVVIVTRQYRTRRTMTNVAIGAVTLATALLLSALFPWNLAWALHDRIETPVSGLEQIQVLAEFAERAQSFGTNLPKRSIAYTFDETNLPEGISLEIFRSEGDLRIASASLPLGLLTDLNFGRNGYPLEFKRHRKQFGYTVIPDSVFERNADSPVTLSGSLYLQAYRDLSPIRMPLPRQDVSVWIGRDKCTVLSYTDNRAELNVLLNCDELEPASGLQFTASVVDENGTPFWNNNVRSSGNSSGRSLFPSMLSPVHRMSLDFTFQRAGDMEYRSPPPGATLILTPREPAGLLRRDFRISSNRLSQTLSQ